MTDVERIESQDENEDFTSVVAEELGRDDDAPEGAMQHPQAEGESGDDSTPDSPTVVIDGKTYDVEQLRAYARTLDWAQADPSRWEQIVEWERRGYVQPPVAEAAPTREPAATPSDDDAWVDPRVAALEARLAATEQSLQAQRDAEERHARDSGWEAFAAAHPSLKPEDLERVRAAAQEWKLDDAAMAREPYPLRRPAAVQAAYEAAYRIAFAQDLATEAAKSGAAATVRDLGRARRAAAASSSPRSTTRSQPEPDMTDTRQMEQWMVQQIAEAQQG